MATGGRQCEGLKRNLSPDTACSRAAVDFRYPGDSADQQEAGADVMKRIAAPMVGGIFTSFLLELSVYPAIYAVWKWNSELRPVLRQHRDKSEP